MSRRHATVTRGMLAGTGGWATVAAGLLVLACVFLAVIGPRASLGMRTRALRESLANVTPLARSVYGYANYPDFSAGVQGRQVTASKIAEARTLLTRNLAGAGLPLAPRSADWSAMWTGFATVAGGAPKAVNDGQRPLIELAYRDTLAGYARLASGRWPAGVHAAGSRLFFEVAVTRATAARFGLRVGSVLLLGPRLALDITGILRVARPASVFWTADPVVLRPRLQQINDNLPPQRTAGAFVGSAEVPQLAARFDVSTISLSWDFPLNLDRLTASQADPLENDLSRAALSAGQLHSADGLIGGLPEPVTLRSGLGDPLTGFTGQDAAIARVLDLLFVSLTVVGTVVLLLGARLLTRQRTRELSLLRARGATLRQIGAVVVRPVAAVTIPAALAGAGCAVALTRGYGTPLAWWLGGLTVSAALAGPPLFAIRERRPALPSRGAREDAPVSRRAAARRAVAEGALIAAAAGGLVLLRHQGQPTTGGVDLYTSMTPALMAIPAAVLVMRVYPPAVRGLLGLAGKRRGVIAFIGLAQASRASLSAILPVFALILALAVIAFGTMLSGAMNRGEVAASWQRTGADAIINSAASARPLSTARRAISGVPGVTRTTAVAVDAGTPVQGMSAGAAITFAVVNPASYANFVAATPDPAFPAVKLVRARPGHPADRAVPVLATPAAAAALGRGTTLVDIALQPVRIRIVGAISRIPGISSSAVVVVPDWAFGTPGSGSLSQATQPNLLLVAGTALDKQRLGALVRLLLPGSMITLRSTALATLAGAPLPRGAYLAFAAGAAGAAVLSVVILLVMLLLSAKPRALTLSRLRTMGLAQGQARWLAAVEVVPQVFAAAAGGVLCALALAPLIGPSIDLSPFTGNGKSVPIRAEPVPLAAVTTGLAILAVLTVAAQAYGAYLRGAARTLRIEDG